MTDLTKEERRGLINWTIQQQKSWIVIWESDGERYTSDPMGYDDAIECKRNVDSRIKSSNGGAWLDLA